MINSRYFPNDNDRPDRINDIVSCFMKIESKVDSEKIGIKSNDVLKELGPYLEPMGYKVENSKRKEDKNRISVKGTNNEEIIAFEVDALSDDEKIVIEIEAGQAVRNYKFLKDLFEVCVVASVDHLCVAVCNVYSYKSNGKILHSKDFVKVCQFFDAVYKSNKWKLPIKGILVIGY